MTDKQILERFEAVGFPKDKTALAATRLIERFANLCANAGILNASPKHNEERKGLFSLAWEDVIKAGPSALQLSPIEERLAKNKKQ
ncbi:hypothetical protein MYX75_02055 [Acidobacteria bacterium AH-259-A15]|nr:hypothetical protein [Acidobacteria bacterium AH-259-A15]